ncbi:TetR/AcrR family transcriptional regulator C-terminal domain-containing protein [Clostridium sp.]|uniref:TetR/AcrR family transcriptional regulator C-terminal domain-containing protein n=1 Tax=Clostridium sp. TaxID=1506 RepID=UPI003D6CCBBE
MNTTPLAKITINDIVRDCGVNRRTFYYHFQDVYALLEWIFRTEVARAMAENTTSRTWQQKFLNILIYLDKNRKMVLNTYNSIGREHLETHLYSAVYCLLLKLFNFAASIYLKYSRVKLIFLALKVVMLPIKMVKYFKITIVTNKIVINTMIFVNHLGSSKS